MKNHNVLIVDDDEITLELLQLILDEFITGKVIPLTSSVKALAFVQSELMSQIDLVICDWQMPDHNGIEVLQAIRRKNKHVPVLMLTGNATRDLVIDAQKNGVSDFAAKPFKNYDLTEKVKSLLA